MWRWGFAGPQRRNGPVFDSQLTVTLAPTSGRRHRAQLVHSRLDDLAAAMPDAAAQVGAGWEDVLAKLAALPWPAVRQRAGNARRGESGAPPRRKRCARAGAPSSRSGPGSQARGAVGPGVASAATARAPLSIVSILSTAARDSRCRRAMFRPSSPVRISTAVLPTA